MSKDLVKDHNKNGLEAANKGDFITAEKEFYKTLFNPQSAYCLILKRFSCSEKVYENS